MEKKKLVNYLVNGLLIGTMLLTSGGAVYASDATAAAASGPAAVGHNFMMKKAVNPGANLQEALQGLVAAGTITQDQVSQLTTYMQSKFQAGANQGKAKGKMPGMHKNGNAATAVQKPDLFADAVTQGIITQDQADAVKTALQQYQAAQRQTKFKNRLDQLVSAGTLTSDQAAAVLQAFENIPAERQAAQAAMQNMTKEERQAYRQAHQSDLNPWQQLVAQGIITQDQLQAIQGNKAAGQGQKSGVNRTDKINQLVADGKLTSDQAAAILKALDTASAERKTAQTAMQNMTQAERKAYRQEHKSDLNPWQQLVASGVITQDQLDALGLTKNHHGNRPAGQANPVAVETSGDVD